jgi:2,5-dioxopentanoate dehydrogenase
MEPVWISGAWRPADSPAGQFRAANPATGEEIGPLFPQSSWADVATAMAAATATATEGQLADADPAALARFFETYAALIEADAAILAELANLETGLPVDPRLLRVEIPRTTSQLRQAAQAVRANSFAHPTIDTRANIRSCYGPLGKPVLVLGPGNFPFAFNSVAGSDFCCALAARNPVLAKSHPGHPGTTRGLVQHLANALSDAGLPGTAVQVFYDLAPEVGLRLAGDRRLGAMAFTGSRRSGLALKAAADAAGVLVYLEMSSVNPVFLLPGAVAERSDALAAELMASVTLGTGQFCTNPGLVVLAAGPAADQFLDATLRRCGDAAPGLLTGRTVLENLDRSVAELVRAGAAIRAGGQRVSGPGWCYAPMVLTVSGRAFLGAPQALSREAFGPTTLIVLCVDSEEVLTVAGALDGNLTASVYSAADGRDDELYRRLAPALRTRVGRLLDDKMPTGVTVSPAMNHGGPFPATGHPGFTAVGIPAAMRRFTSLTCYDNVREHHLPAVLRNRNPGGVWRNIDGRWTQEDIP